MKDLEKLNNIIVDLEHQSESLKSFTEAYSKIISIEKKINDNFDSLKESSKIIENVSNNLTSNIVTFQSQIHDLVDCTHLG